MSLEEVVEDLENSTREEILRRINDLFEERGRRMDKYEKFFYLSLEGLLSLPDFKEKLRILQGYSLSKLTSKEKERFYIYCSVLDPEDDVDINISFVKKLGSINIVSFFENGVGEWILRRVERNFLKEIERKKDELENDVYLFTHKTEFHSLSDFWYKKKFTRISEKLPPIIDLIIGINANEFSKLGELEGRMVIRHELYELLLPWNQSTERIEFGEDRKIDWYGNLRNALINTKILEEEREFITPFFNGSKKDLLKLIKRLKSFKLSEYALRKRGDIFSSISMALSNVEFTFPFRSISSREEYKELDKLAERIEGKFNPFGTEFRHELEEFMVRLEMKINGDKIEEEKVRKVRDFLRGNLEKVESLEPITESK